jgi:hypothetical protein
MAAWIYRLLQVVQEGFILKLSHPNSATTETARFVVANTDRGQLTTRLRGFFLMPQPPLLFQEGSCLTKRCVYRQQLLSGS